MNAAKKAEAVIDVIDNEIFHLSSVFATYKRLFRGDKKIRELLIDSDLAFFNDLYIIYLQYVSVAVSRLLDPERTGNKANLTIFTLISILDADGYPEAEEMRRRLNSIKARAYNFTDPRNQLVSHLDFKANCIGPKKRPIPSFIVSEFEEFYKDVGILLNDIRATLKMPPSMYDWGVFGHGCGRKLVSRLQTAYEYVNRKTEANQIQAPNVRPASDL